MRGGSSGKTRRQTENLKGTVSDREGSTDHSGLLFDTNVSHHYSRPYFNASLR